MSKTRIATLALVVSDEETDEQLSERLQKALPKGVVASVHLRDPDEPLRKAVLISSASEPIEIGVDNEHVNVRGRDGSVAVPMSALVDH